MSDSGPSPSPSNDQSREQRALGAPALEDVRDALEASVQAYRQGDYQEAQAQAENALRDMPNQPDGLHLIALISHELGAHDAAIGYIERALAVTPDNAAYQNNLATMYLAAGRKDDARAILGRLMDNHPDYPGGYYNLANIFKADGDLQLARNHYRLALSHQPDFVDAHVNLPRRCSKWALLTKPSIRRVWALRSGRSRPTRMPLLPPCC